MNEGPATGSPSQDAPPLMSRLKREFLAFITSLQEGFQYVKATIIGQAKKVKARDEKEATEADLQTAKMQVEASDAAEDKKNQLEM